MKHLGKILLFDIETSPMVAYTWRLGYNIQLGTSNLIEDKKIICICYKWLGNKTTSSLTWDENQDDKKMIEDFIKILNSADQIIAHNGDRFDLPTLKARAVIHSLPMLPKYQTLDTLLKARKEFKFASNKLDDIAKSLNLGRKIETNFDLWKGVLSNDAKSLKYMVKYCKQDVNLLEQVYLKLESYFPQKIHFGKLYTGDVCSCPTCGSKDFRIKQKRFTSTASGSIRVQLQCNNCNRYVTMNEKTYKKILEDN